MGHRRANPKPFSCRHPYFQSQHDVWLVILIIRTESHIFVVFKKIRLKRNRYGRTVLIFLHLYLVWQISKAKYDSCVTFDEPCKTYNIVIVLQQVLLLGQLDGVILVSYIQVSSRTCGLISCK